MKHSIPVARSQPFFFSDHVKCILYTTRQFQMYRPDQCTAAGDRARVHWRKYILQRAEDRIMCSMPTTVYMYVIVHGISLNLEPDHDGGRESDGENQEYEPSIKSRDNSASSRLKLVSNCNEWYASHLRRGGEGRGGRRVHVKFVPVVGQQAYLHVM